MTSCQTGGADTKPLMVIGATARGPSNIEALGAIDNRLIWAGRPTAGRHGTACGWPSPARPGAIARLFRSFGRAGGGAGIN